MEVSLSSLCKFFDVSMVGDVFGGEDCGLRVPVSSVTNALLPRSSVGRAPHRSVRPCFAANGRFGDISHELFV